MSHRYICYTEIMEQVGALEECVQVVTAQRNEIISFFKSAQPDEIIFIGCTSPHYVGKSVAYYWQSALGIPTSAVTASEFVQFPESILCPHSKKPLLIAISRSGKTSETIWAIESFERNYPGRTVLISCMPEARMTQLAALNILLPKGMEVTLAQTKSFASMHLAALMMCAILSEQEALLELLTQVPQQVQRVLAEVDDVICRIFLEQVRPCNITFLGSGPFYGIAQEAALKMLEMTLSEVMSYPFLESRHGPKSIIGKDSLVVGLMSHAGFGYEAQVLREYTEKHGATTLAVTPLANWQAGDATYSIPVNVDLPDTVLGLLYLPVIQLMAYYRAIAKGVNPDESNNLTQFIEIEKVSPE